MTLRRKYTGAKPNTEAMDVERYGRGALQCRRSVTERTRGEAGRENAGVSSGTLVRIQRTENPRIPEEGSSALGKSGPKARPKGVVDGQQVEIPVLLGGVKERRRRLVGHADGRAWASEVTDKGEKPLLKREDVKRMERSDASTEEDDASFQEKLLA